MPIACDPNAVRNYVLKGDRDKPEAERPVFLLRYLTRRQKRACRALGDDLKALEAMEPLEVSRRLYEALAAMLAGWRGLRAPEGEPVAFNAADLTALDAALADRELWELYFAGLSDLEEADLNFSGSRPSTGPAADAECDAPGDAGGGAKDARRPRHAPSPTSTTAPPAAAAVRLGSPQADGAAVGVAPTAAVGASGG